MGMQEYNNGEITKAQMEKMDKIRELFDTQHNNPLDRFLAGNTDQVVIARLDLGLQFYIKGLKFELTEINEDKTIKARLIG